MSKGNENEPAKLLLPFLQRADELQTHDPLVAYYCRLYAMERGLKIPQTERTKTTNALLVSLMKQLEKDKKSLELTPDDGLHIEGFALNVFAKADKQDRAGRADKGTAKTFYAASIFFEILNQFGQLQPDLEQKQKYAAWKAADISKALKEGRKPVPGPPGVDNDLSSPSSIGFNPETSNMDPAPKSAPEFDPSSHNYDKIDRQLSSNTAPSHPSSFLSSTSPNIAPSSYTSTTNKIQSPSFPQPPSTDDYPSHNFHQQPLNDDYPSLQPPNLTSRSENNSNDHLYQQQPFPEEPQPHLPQYQTQDIPSHSFPNFQTYPSFTESSLPAAPSHYPSFYQGPDSSYNITSASIPLNFPSTAQQSSNGRNGNIPDPAPISVQEYQYDSNYQPSPEKIAEAHKAAKFAVGALAFDDVSIAIDYLKKSLELLTNPSAGQ
ncbi:LOW QUALITY PROTEIN: protein HOMOLOG OF MAMMALIAN LYST-INTERACTING PROTEIN 5-like [Daucus carota subsp. sativus]|uniref:LOW QUALITY PROTEIN: protein HOMOLOG OF MAMMALIAN LYST-INTERACTING PROTEIN 5-like n=1 Tax=Daucus carota subsp. sativus TaxID=79200 RepID=UPI0007EF77F4|nr:PREDICTED: LOW QUALITY PROTEIN: protein HOMOLOG OF MAMMALIAN LYST-INTERACTING PROTEIN 5-like [Daucus carota subsp. sativus]